MLRARLISAIVIVIVQGAEIPALVRACGSDDRSGGIGVLAEVILSSDHADISLGQRDLRKSGKRKQCREGKK